jgi:hypothetical protein
MPNALVHIGLQTPVSSLLIRDADVKWIVVGCIIPDIPWIMQRIITFALPAVDPLDLRMYAVIQASLVFCLLFALALAMTAARPGRIFLLLGLNAFLHLWIDAMQTKWANGVHFLAPFSWKAANYSSVWPEHFLVYLLSLTGLVILAYHVFRNGNGEIVLTTRIPALAAGAALLAGYLFSPFLLLQAPEAENAHYAATLRHREDRPGKYIEFDRARYRAGDRTLRVFTGERFRLLGSVPEDDALLSLKGRFMDAGTIRVEDFHRHTAFRDLASLAGLGGAFFLWLLAIFGKRIRFTGKHRQ